MARIQTDVLSPDGPIHPPACGAILLPTSETYVCNGNKREMALALDLPMPAGFALKTMPSQPLARVRPCGADALHCAAPLHGDGSNRQLPEESSRPC